MHVKDPARRKFWGWGVEGAGPSRDQIAAIGRSLQARFPGAELAFRAPPTLDELSLPAPRLAAPPATVGTEVVSLHLPVARGHGLESAVAIDRITS